MIFKSNLPTLCGNDLEKMGDFQKTSHHPLIDLAGEKLSVLQKATKPPSDELDGQKLSNFGNAIPTL